MTLDQHKMHLFKLLAPPFTYHWWAQVKHRASEIAKEDETCSELPALVLAEYQRLKILASTSPAQ